ncbi:MAG: flagellin lysine-N-methylase [Tissierellales bacterium]|nr:flagellin lysine-N-methylase [Tissierellales bacterium]
MDDYAYINDNTSIPNINYGIISLTEDYRCPFLDRDNLCTLQKKSGEGGLSNVCALYPRYYNLVDGVYEESLSLACIEAAETLLLGETLETIKVNRGPKRDVIFQNIKTQAQDATYSAMCHLYDFRKLVFELLKSEKHTFDEKLGMLMNFHEHVEGMDDDRLKTALASYDFTCNKMTIGIDETLHGKLIDFLKIVGASGH